MKDLLGLKVEFINARVYDVSPALFGGKKFDLVLMGSILMHLRDPIGALMAVHSVCRDRLIANSLKPPEPEDETRPFMQLLAEPNPFGWWMPNKLVLKSGSMGRVSLGPPSTVQSTSRSINHILRRAAR